MPIVRISSGRSSSNTQPVIRSGVTTSTNPLSIILHLTPMLSRQCDGLMMSKVFPWLPTLGLAVLIEMLLARLNLAEFYPLGDVWVSPEVPLFVDQQLARATPFEVS